MKRALLESGGVTLSMTLRATPTAEAVWARPPIFAAARTWGDEVYFDAGGLELAREPDATDLMRLGEIAYRPDGDAIAVGFGETPISAPGEIRLAAPGDVWADADGDPTALRAVRPGDQVRLERLGAEA